MITLKDFKSYSISTANNILGGANGTTGSGTCATENGSGSNCEPGSNDCKSYSYSDDCNGENRVIESEEICEGSC